MKTAIIGGNGQLGMDLMKAFAGENSTSLTHTDIEIENTESVSRALTALKPDLVVNTAAYHKVEDCEKNPERSFQVNALGALNLARVCESMGTALVHVSTDYVFDGKKASPYIETDLPNPLNVYAATKLSGEHFVQAYSSKHYVIRSSGLYGHSPCRAKGRNFIDTMLKLSKERQELRVVNDEILTPTYTYHLARQIRELVTRPAYGVYHVTNNGSCSWYEFAMEIFKLSGTRVTVVPVPAKEFPAPIKRPSYSVLENKGLQSLGIDHMPHWRESLAHYFSTRTAAG
ncbi:MAG: dTDP-4-dehydrorhamnose reductase [Ignavibacteriae bacterium]|nr:dTDP-4-dehydrorhamnose reductase [Ignavibacteria bacterium]MBI3364603.1 dTDP-4-dehydrorhamnose reductase [Ignavibacteriota bacterium]